MIIRPDSPVEIVENLFQSPCADHETIQAGAFDHVIFLAKELLHQAPNYQRPDRTYDMSFANTMYDGPLSFSDLHSAQQAARLAVELVRAGKKVLVMCLAGLDRSGLVCALVYKELASCSGIEAAKHIRLKRGPHALQNQTYFDYLKDLP